MGGKVHVTNAPKKAVRVPKYGPKTMPNIDAIKASKLIVISGTPMAGTYGVMIERT